MKIYISRDYSINRIKRFRACAESMRGKTKRSSVVWIECQKWLGNWGWTGVSWNNGGFYKGI